jgi:hypothetical protein
LPADVLKLPADVNQIPGNSKCQNILISARFPAVIYRVVAENMGEVVSRKTTCRTEHSPHIPPAVPIGSHGENRPVDFRERSASLSSGEINVPIPPVNGLRYVNAPPK